MKSMRKAIAFSAVLAVVGTGCSRFVPKADVGVNKVAVDLAFGVEDLLATPTPTPTQPVIDVLTPTPTSTSSVFPPPPPLPPACLPVQAYSSRDGEAPPSMVPGEFDPNDPKKRGNDPRPGLYYYTFDANLSGERVERGAAYLEVSKIVPEEAGPGSYAYHVAQPFPNGIDMEFTIIYEGESTAGQESATGQGIYLSGLTVPLKGAEIARTHYGPVQPPPGRQFLPVNADRGGLKLAAFPLTSGESIASSQPNTAVNNTEVGGQSLPYGPPSETIATTTTVGQTDDVFVCDQVAQAWQFSMQIEVTSDDTDFIISGTFMFATQYGGWPIQSVFAMDGGSEYVSGNFRSTLGRLDPGRVT